MYRSVVEDVMAIPVICGEKPENERFPGADRTYSIEAMMQDGKALQAGTSHYLGTHFAEAQNIRYQDKDGGMSSRGVVQSWGTAEVQNSVRAFPLQCNMASPGAGR